MIEPMPNVVSTWLGRSSPTLQRVWVLVIMGSRSFLVRFDQRGIVIEMVIIEDQIGGGSTSRSEFKQVNSSQGSILGLRAGQS